MWVARDKSGRCIYAFQGEPIECNNHWKDFGYFSCYSLEELGLDEKDFEWVTFENSPVEFSCKPIFKK